MTKKKAKHADTIYEMLKPKLIHVIRNKGSVTKYLKTFAECSIAGSVMVYFISTIILLTHNLVVGIPFAPLSIIQAVVITIYFCIFAGAYILAEHLMCSLWRLMRTEADGKLRKAVRFVCILLTAAAIAVMAGSVLYLFLRSFLGSILIVVVLMLISLMCRNSLWFFEKPQDCTRANLAYATFISTVIIWLLPASVGGLSSQKVLYYDDSNVCQEYDYYGVVNGMLVLKNEGQVSLPPVGRGRIEYTVSNYSFLGPTKDEQKRCEVNPNSPAPEDE